MDRNMNHKRMGWFAAAVFLAAAPVFAAEEVPSAPAVNEASPEGYAVTTGGEGGATIEVTNLDDSGPGSLRAACEQASKGKSVIVFEVGGTIYPKTTVVLGGSDITVDGATAPAPGITLNASRTENPGEAKGDGPLFMMEKAHRTIVRHMRFRDAITANLLITAGSSHVILDHVSSTGCSDMALNLNPSSDITLRYCLFAGNVLCMRVHGTRLSIHHCLYSNNHQRHPYLHTTPGVIDYRNNVIQKWTGYGIGVYPCHKLNLVNNVFGPPHAPEPRAAPLWLRGWGDLGGGFSAESRKRFSAQFGDKHHICASGNTGAASGPIPELATSGEPFEPQARVTTHSAEEALKIVLAEAGARPLDEIDRAFVEGRAEGTAQDKKVRFGEKAGVEKAPDK